MIITNDPLASNVLVITRRGFKIEFFGISNLKSRGFWIFYPPKIPKAKSHETKNTRDSFLPKSRKVPDIFEYFKINPDIRDKS